MAELLVSGQEGHAVDVAIILDLAVNLISKECLNCVVELVLEQMISDFLHGVVGPVGVLNTVQEAIVLGHPQAVLKGLEVCNGIQAIF